MSKIFKWMDENLKSHKPVTGGEDFADSIGLLVIMALVCLVIFL